MGGEVKRLKKWQIEVWNSLSPFKKYSLDEDTIWKNTVRNNSTNRFGGEVQRLKEQQIKVWNSFFPSGLVLKYQMADGKCFASMFLNFNKGSVFYKKLTSLL